MNTITLTPLGTQAAETARLRGPEFAVLSTLYETGGPMDFDELVEILHTDEVKASMIVRRLINVGYIKEV